MLNEAAYEIEVEQLLMTGQVCPYCGQDTEHVHSSEVYKRTHGMIYICRDCQAWVGCHKSKPDEALGMIANAELRAWRRRAHFYFDHLWRRKIHQEGLVRSHARNKGYKWLREEMGLTKFTCHIARFDIERCQQAITICEPHYRGAHSLKDVYKKIPV